MFPTRPLEALKSPSRKILGYFLIIVINLLYASLYFAYTFPVSEGWNVNYAELVLRGNVPYRDFFFYLPPLVLFIDTVRWILSFGSLLIFRGWYVIERVIIYLLVYNLLCRHFKWQTAAGSCVFASIFCTADSFDLFGDYNQIVILFTVLLAYSAIAFVDGKTTQEKIKSLFLSGIVFGLLFLIKQTIFLASALCYFSILTILCILNKDKNSWKYYLAVFVGCFVPLIPFVVYLLLNGAFYQFVDQVFISINGKGSIWNIVVNAPLRSLFHWDSWILALLLFAILELGKNKAVDTGVKKRIILILTVAVACAFFDSVDVKEYFQAVCTSYKFILLVLASFLPLCFVMLFKRKNSFFSILFNACLLFSGCVFCIGVGLSDLTYHAIFSLNYISLSQFNYALFYLFLLLFLSQILRLMLFKGKKTIDLAWIMLSGAAFSLYYAFSMAAGIDSIVFQSMRITIPMVLCVIFSYDKSENCSQGIKYVIAIWCVVLCTFCVAQKAVLPYSWWGCSSTESREQKMHIAEHIPELKGVYFSENDKTMYETITRLIIENSSEDDVVFGYPYLKIFNILSHRYNSTFVPVMWYDVVGDKYVEYTIEEFSEKLPEIIVWMEIPDALDIHEEIYRNGVPLVQREFEAMLQTILPQKYTLLGNASGIEVYRLNDEYR